ncbi:hypothetical protein [Chondromyces apiculatus]|uniref:Basic proline-rich protein n=1 Tax=Chondromyces apiculatus DSM 436 TaxID=1192034 RepID=A0A017T1F9_9BACT|nr:hypothetical protein [Chondromyces apiculatus]EYF02406.1 Basic proline-rich protein [Chondromyces apiculatus DSM 436]
MRTFSSFLPALMALAACQLGCGGSTPPPETAEPESAAEPEPEPPSAAAEPEPEPERVAPGLKSASTDTSIPDDYSISRGDCAQLGNQLATVTRSDQLAQLSPKLTAAQRTQADKNITDVATRMGEKWTAGCEESLVGKIGDRQSIVCALSSKTVKAFDECLNTKTGEK